MPKEAEGIRSLTNDPNPVRVSENDRRHLGTRAPLRVAGSLAVARALGDSYLKVAELSTSQYAPHVPYITGRPTISYRPLRSSDRKVPLQHTDNNQQLESSDKSPHALPPITISYRPLRDTDRKVPLH